MPKQKVPDIDFGYWVLPEIKELFHKGGIYINEEYQRGDIWKHSQQVELIKSIENRYSIGVLVLFVNDSKQFEILDGQQRLLTILKYLQDKLELKDSDILKYSDLKVQEKTLIDAYCVYYIKLKSHDAESKEEDIVQTFLRLQEGTPLNKAEKLNAYRGKFKDTFRDVAESHPLFSYLGPEKRFRWRQLAAELLTLELETDFKKRIFPDLDLPSMISMVSKYKDKISPKKIKFLRGNLDFLVSSLNIVLTAFTPREVISFYLLVSYLRQHKANNSNLINELSVFSKDFLEILNSFSIYDEHPPKNMSNKQFIRLKNYKQEAKILTTGESIQKRFEIILGEYNRLHPIIIKDEKRLHDVEQKRTLYFRQQGLCAYCNKDMDFRASSSHHGMAHSEGGITDDLAHAQLMHIRCHQKYERIKEKKKKKITKS